MSRHICGNKMFHQICLTIFYNQNGKLEKNYLSFINSEIFPNIAILMYTQDDRFYIRAGGYSTQYFSNNNSYIIGKIENNPLAEGNRFLPANIFDSNGTLVASASVGIWMDGTIIMYTHGLSLQENMYNTININTVITF